MTFRNANRKRGRTNEELDFMPISKKMNDLHIRSNHVTSQGIGNNNLYTFNPMLSAQLSSRDVASAVPDQVSNVVMQSTSHPVLESQKNSYCDDANVTIENIYAPELNSTQNPYYYHINSVLYEAHLLRLQRLSKLEIEDIKTSH